MRYFRSLLVRCFRNRKSSYNTGRLTAAVHSYSRWLLRARFQFSRKRFALHRSVSVWL